MPEMGVSAPERRVVAVRAMAPSKMGRSNIADVLCDQFHMEAVMVAAQGLA
jgi:hypothetical protein